MTPTSDTGRRDVWLIRLYYFTWIGAGGFLYPYISLFYVRTGLTGTQIGLIATVTSAAALIAAPVWGRWSDAAEHPRYLLAAGLIGNAVLHLAISQQHLFLWMALLFAMQSLIAGGLGPLSDTLALGVARGAGYGSIRLWGSLGWAILVLVSGSLIERFGLIAGFVGYAAMTVTAALIVFLSLPAPARTADAPRASRVTVKTTLRSVLADRSLLGLGLVLVILWLTGKGVTQFEPIFMDELGANEFLIGLASTIGAAVELPAMLLADRLVKRFGAGWVFRAGIAFHIVRMVLILLAPSVATILVMRVAEGFAFSFTAIAMVIYIARRAPNQQVAVIMALYTVTLAGLVNLGAGPLGGAIYDWVGAYWLYLLALVGDVLAFIVMMFTHRPAARRIESG